MIHPPHADLPEVPIEGVTFEAVRVGSNPPTWKWHCPSSGTTWLHLRSAQDCQFGQVHLIASARQYDDGRVRYKKPYGFAALKSQSKVSGRGCGMTEQATFHPTRPDLPAWPHA